MSTDVLSSAEAVSGQRPVRATCASGRWTGRAGPGTL